MRWSRTPGPKRAAAGAAERRVRRIAFAALLVLLAGVAGAWGIGQVTADAPTPAPPGRTGQVSQPKPPPVGYVVPRRTADEHRNQKLCQTAYRTVERMTAGKRAKDTPVQALRVIDEQVRTVASMCGPTMAAKLDRERLIAFYR